MIVAHADWASSPRKRWACVAVHDSSGTFAVEAPEPVGDPSTFLERLAPRGRSPLFVGFDFPIGLPIAYAKRFGIRKFVDALPTFGQGAAAEFFDPADVPSNIALTRPFYPRRPGGTKRQHLIDALGVANFGELLRQCELQTNSRQAACSLFWILGGNQVGRAAIIGWRDVLQPALRQQNRDIAVWPFHGDLASLLDQSEIVIAETYPAEACLHLGLTAPGRGWSKRSQAGRKAQAPILHSWATRRSIKLSPTLSAQLDDGFGAGSQAEDLFDSVAGLFGMLEVVLGFRAPGNPSSTDVRDIEGWILGQAAPHTPSLHQSV
jgi:hypothetical protein